MNATMDAAVATGTADAGDSAAADGAAAAATAIAAAVAPAQDAPISENPNQHEEDPVAAEVVAAAPWRCAPAPNGNAKGPGDAAKCVKCLKRYGKSSKFPGCQLVAGSGLHSVVYLRA